MTTHPAPQLALIADDLYSFAQIEEAWGDVVPLPRVHFDAFRTHLGKLREFYSKCSPVVDPDRPQSHPEAELPELPEPFMELHTSLTPVVYDAWAAQMRAYGQQCAATRPVSDVPAKQASDYTDGEYGPADLAAIWNACRSEHLRTRPAEVGGDGVSELVEAARRVEKVWRENLGNGSGLHIAMFGSDGAGAQLSMALEKFPSTPGSEAKS